MSLIDRVFCSGMRWPAPTEDSTGSTRLYSDFTFHATSDDAQTFGKNQFTGRTMDIIEGEIELPPHIGKTVQKGLVFVPFHFHNLDKKEAANELTIDFVDPLSKQPTFKQSACTVEKIRNVHEMDSEDTVESIAKQYGLTSSELLVANRKPSPYELQIGERVEIPLSVINTPLQRYMPY